MRRSAFALTVRPVGQRQPPQMTRPMPTTTEPTRMPSPSTCAASATPRSSTRRARTIAPGRRSTSTSMRRISRPAGASSARCSRCGASAAAGAVGCSRPGSAGRPTCAGRAHMRPLPARGGAGRDAGGADGGFSGRRPGGPGRIADNRDAGGGVGGATADLHQDWRKSRATRERAEPDLTKSARGSPLAPMRSLRAGSRQRAV